MTVLLGIAIGTALAILALAARIVTGLAVKEVDGWIPRVSELMVRRAGRRLPPDVAPRWVEEQSRHLEEYEDRPLSMLGHALAVVRQARALAAELEREAEPVRERSTGWRDTLADGRNRIAVTAAAVARRLSDGRGRLAAAVWRRAGSFPMHRERVFAISVALSVAPSLLVALERVGTGPTSAAPSVLTVVGAAVLVQFVWLLWRGPRR